jgi:hypothetical protein
LAPVLAGAKASVLGRNAVAIPPARKGIAHRRRLVCRVYMVAIPPRMNGAKAEIPRPILKQKPEPVVRMRVGNSSP